MMENQSTEQSDQFDRLLLDQDIDTTASHQRANHDFNIRDVSPEQFFMKAWRPPYNRDGSEMRGLYIEPHLAALYQDPELFHPAGPYVSGQTEYSFVARPSFRNISKTSDHDATGMDRYNQNNDDISPRRVVSLTEMILSLPTSHLDPLEEILNSISIETLQNVRLEVDDSSKKEVNHIHSMIDTKTEEELAGEEARSKNSQKDPASTALPKDLAENGDMFLSDVWLSDIVDTERPTLIDLDDDKVHENVL